MRGTPTTPIAMPTAPGVRNETRKSTGWRQKPGRPRCATPAPSPTTMKPKVRTKIAAPTPSLMSAP